MTQVSAHQGDRKAYNTRMVLSPEEIKARLKSLGISPDKYLGQHFLIDQSVLDTIKATAQTFLLPGDTILEVGPGLGVLTAELVALAPVIAVEKDPIFARALPHQKNLTVIQGDILRELDSNVILSEVEESRTDNKFRSFDKLRMTAQSWVVVANIPYAITSPLLRQLLYRANPPHDILVLIQKEVAERITAQPGNRERGLLTVEIEARACAKIITTVPPTAFWPEPKVESALIHLQLKPSIGLPDSFRSVVAAGFSLKRKKLANSLSATWRQPVDEVRQRLDSLAIDPNRRAETLSLEEWQKLAQKMNEPA